MECNRDEAVRARDIAEQKYAKQDFLGAKKFLLKAQQLFPTLEGLNHMMPVVEVHSVAQLKVGSNETDWYGILQVEPSADDSTVKKQYRRLALLLHPDKNKSVGAEAAFKLISEAWGTLSDKTKRAVHNMRRNVKPKVPHTRVAMEPNMQSFQTPYSAPPPPVPVPPPAPTPSPTPNPAHHANGAFWTSCPACKMQYQYLRTYENYQLQCPKCKEYFMARDIHSTAADTGAGGYGWPHFEGHRQDFNFNKAPPPTTTGGFNGASAPNGFMNGAFGIPFPNQAGSGPFFSPAATAAASQSKVAAAAAAAASANNMAADVVQQTYQKVKRERVEAEKEIKRIEKETRRKEKEDQRKEREEHRKAREAEHKRDALDRLMSKKKENVAREDIKRNVDARTSRKLKRKRRNSSPGDAENDDDDDSKSFEQGLEDDLSAPPMTRRRSSRNKKNVASYKVDVSDDSDLEEFPASRRRNKVEGEEFADDTDKSEENGREPGAQQAHRENGGKGKSIADDTNHEKRGSVDSGMNGTEEFDGERRRRPVTETSKDYQVGTTEKESYESGFVGTGRRSDGVARDSKMYEESSGDALKMKSGKSSQQVESPPAAKGMDCEAIQEGGNVFKSQDFRDEKSPSKSPRTLRMRVKSPKVTYSSQSVGEEGRRLHQRVSPTVSAVSSDGEDESADAEVNISVPDPDFHDFDSERTENDIMPGQIWAIYDDLDGMPRFYGRISRVTQTPFRAHLCWLELSSPFDKRKAKFEKASLACGEYKVGKVTILTQINTFSHIVMDKAAGKGLVKVYPKVNQVWAMFRDLDPHQRSAPLQVPGGQGIDGSYSYDMVEILGDFYEEKGVKTVKLVKVKGYKTLFRRKESNDAFRTFKPSEVQNFSHSVPVQRMTDKDADQCGVPRGSLELDPASTPMDLINDQSDRSS